MPIDLSAPLALTALFAGEEVIDVYHYGHLIGRPLKEPILCLQYERKEVFKGGIEAAANDARDFCSKVEVDSRVTIYKERYVDEAHTRKLFEFCSRAWPRAVRVSDWGGADLVAVIDYGHGMFDDALIDKICGQAKFLALNVQTNSANYGFNLATRWPRADYLVVDEAEARLATGKQHADIRECAGVLAKRFPKIALTLGRAGAVGLDREEGFIATPAFTDRVVDTMGAGDAFFAISALHASRGAPLAELLALGNAAGAAKTQIIGHREILTRAHLAKYRP